MSASAGRTADPVALARFFDISLDLLALADANGRLTRVSRSWEAALGWTAVEMTSGPFLGFFHPDDRAAATDAFTAIFAGQSVISFGTRCRHRDGSYRDLEWNAYREQGDPFVYAVARDVTESRRRDRRFRALNSAWLAVAGEKTLGEVLEVLNEQARLLIGARQAVTSLTVGDRWEQAVSAVSLSEPCAPWRSYDALPDGSGIYAEVVRSGRPLRLTQAELVAHPLWRGFGAAARDHPPMRGWLAVPMVGRAAQCLGLIQLSDREDGADFDEADEEALTEFAWIAALTVERTQAEDIATAAGAEVAEMLDTISDPFVVFDGQWRLIYISPAAQRFVRSGRDVIGETIWQAFPQAAQDRFRPHFEEAMATRVSSTFRSHNPVTHTWFEIRVSPYRDGLAVYFVDVTVHETALDDLEQRVAMQAIVAEIGQAALTGIDVDTLMEDAIARVHHNLQVSRGGVLQLSGDGQALTVRCAFDRGEGPAAVSLKGLTISLDSLAGTAIARAIDEFDWAILDYGAGEGAQPAQDLGMRSALAVPVGRRDAVWGVLVVADDQPGRFGIREGVFLSQLAHILSSALERHEAEFAVRHQAMHDALTGLPNRQFLRDRMDAALAQLTAGGDGPTLLFCDLDGFKDVNDSLGHATGDLVLRQVADRLEALVGERGTVARLGGDEFAVLIGGEGGEEAARVLAEQVVATVAVPFSLPELDVPLSTSVGVVRAPAHGSDASTLMRHADVAMYRAKSQSLGWAVYDNELDAARADRLTTIAELRRGILGNELELHYQPIIDLETQAVSSLEALVRWRHPVVGLVPPLSFIPLAEQTGLIIPLTAWVVEEALRQSELWSRAGFTVPIAVNLSVEVLTREAATDPLLARLRGAAARLTAEITESSLADERARHAVISLAAAGVACAVDDFGTGYSSLAYLKDLPIAQLKIDRAFVMDVTRSPRDTAIVRSVADLGAALDLDVVAEGVEDEASAQALRTCGVRLAQGYFFARPMPAPAFDLWLASRETALPARELNDPWAATDTSAG